MTFASTNVEAMLAEYRSLASEMAAANKGNNLWWYTWPSSYDHQNIPIFEALSEQNAARRALDRAGETLVLEVSDHLMAQAVAAMARSAGWRVSIPLSVRLAAARSQVTRRIRQAASILKGLKDILDWKQAAQRFPVAEAPGRTALLVSPLDAQISVDADGWLQDRYFGFLPRFLDESGERIASLGFPIGSPAKVASAVTKAARPNVLTFGHLIGYGDILRVAARVLTHPIRATKDPISQLCLDGSWRDLLRFATMEVALRAYLARQPDARIIHTYENNPWERAVALAGHASGRRIVGFSHAAIIPNNPKNYVSEAERDLRPGPSEIVCTGPAARSLFLSLGHHDPTRVLAACHLRGPAVPATPRPGRLALRLDRVLVILQGYSTASILHAIVQAEWDRPRQFILRGHPIRPAELILARSGLAASDLLLISREKDLQRDLEAADAIIYCGSSVALTAVAMGIPAIHFVRPTWGSEDPLLHSAALKKVAATPAGLLAACQSFERMTHEQYLSEAEAAHRYVVNYFAPVSPENMARFTSRVMTEAGV